MPLRDLLGSPRDAPYADADPRNPKNYYKIMHDRRKADEAAQDRRMSEAYADGKLQSHRHPAAAAAAEQGEQGGVGRQTAVEAGARGRKIPGVISHNDALYFATASGWTHTERWQPSAADERERLRRLGHGDAVAVSGPGSGPVGVGGGDGVGGDKGWDEHGGEAVEQSQGGRPQGKGEGEGRKKSVGGRVKSFVFGAAGVTKE